MKKIMLIGRCGCGKTTLTQALNKEKLKYKKTQTIEFIGSTMDTPGEYIENRRYYNALIVSSADSDVIAFVQGSTDEESIFPPGFANIFAKPVIGIITKMDLCDNGQRGRRILEMAGVENIYEISAVNDEGIQGIIDLLT